MLISETNDRWILPGEEILVGGYTISGGYLYVGTSLQASSEPWQSNVNPSLININFPIAKTNPDTKGDKMSYWPSYSEIEPDCRLAYLQWLASGKKNPNASIGYVFLYFYGIERRVVIDKPPSCEILSLLKKSKGFVIFMQKTIHLIFILNVF